MFSTIYADPPWEYNSPKAIVGNGGRGADNGNVASIIQIDVENHYKTMSVEELKSLNIKNITNKNAHLYLWFTNGFAVEAHDIARTWGFKPKTILTWVKVHKNDNTKASMKCGYWYRSCTEHILFAVKGSLKLVGKQCMPTAYMLPRLPHSVKPPFFYELIEKNSPGPYLELFARNVREGWDSWGNEIKSTIEL